MGYLFFFFKRIFQWNSWCCLPAATTRGRSFPGFRLWLRLAAKHTCWRHLVTPVKVSGGQLISRNSPRMQTSPLPEGCPIPKSCGRTGRWSAPLIFHHYPSTLTSTGEESYWLTPPPLPKKNPNKQTTKKSSGMCGEECSRPTSRAAPVVWGHPIHLCAQGELSTCAWGKEERDGGRAGSAWVIGEAERARVTRWHQQSGSWFAPLDFFSF